MYEYIRNLTNIAFYLVSLNPVPADPRYGDKFACIVKSCFLLKKIINWSSAELA